MQSIANSLQVFGGTLSTTVATLDKITSRLVNSDH